MNSDKKSFHRELQKKIGDTEDQNTSLMNDLKQCKETLAKNQTEIDSLNSKIVELKRSIDAKDEEIKRLLADTLDKEIAQSTIINKTPSSSNETSEEIVSSKQQNEKEETGEINHTIEDKSNSLNPNLSESSAASTPYSNKGKKSKKEKRPESTPTSNSQPYHKSTRADQAKRISRNFSKGTFGQELLKKVAATPSESLYRYIPSESDSKSEKQETVSETQESTSEKQETAVVNTDEKSLKPGKVGDVDQNGVLNLLDKHLDETKREQSYVNVRSEHLAESVINNGNDLTESWLYDPNKKHS